MRCNPLEHHNFCQHRSCRWHMQAPMANRTTINEYLDELEEKLDNGVNPNYILRELWKLTECLSSGNCLLKRRAGEKLTLDEIADLMGISHQAVQQAEEAALQKLQTNPWALYLAGYITVNQLNKPRVNGNGKAH